jgi:hypothetical protein
MSANITGKLGVGVHGAAVLPPVRGLRPRKILAVQRNAVARAICGFARPVASLPLVRRRDRGGAGYVSDTPLPAALVRRGERGLLHRPHANGLALAYVYFEDEPGRRAAAHMLSRPRIAANMRQAAVLSKEGVR